MSLRIARLQPIQHASFRLQTRFASTDTSKLIIKAKSAAFRTAAALSSAPEKATKYADCASKMFSFCWAKAVYGVRVSAEVAKEVYKKEQMAPPSIEQFKQAKGELCSLVQNFDPTTVTKTDMYKAAYYGTQIYGFFLVGEIIGRFNLFGYVV